MFDNMTNIVPRDGSRGVCGGVGTPPNLKNALFGCAIQGCTPPYWLDWLFRLFPWKKTKFSTLGRGKAFNHLYNGLFGRYCM